MSSIQLAVKFQYFWVLLYGTDIFSLAICLASASFLSCIPIIAFDISNIKLYLLKFIMNFFCFVNVADVEKKKKIMQLPYNMFRMDSQTVSEVHDDIEVSRLGL